MNKNTIHHRIIAILFIYAAATMVMSSPDASCTALPREPLWPDGAPLAKGTDPGDIPSITIHMPNGHNTGAAVVICPGGGYGHLALGHEGRDIAAWLNSLGITGIVLEYRMSAGGYHHPVPLMDVGRAIRTVRSRAGTLGIDPSRVGVMGFSAGGHLASTAGTHFDRGDASSHDPVERMSSRPDFMILCYPVIAFGEPYTHKGSQKNLIGGDPSGELVRSLSSEKQVTADTPPAFLFHTDEDKAVPAENSVMFYLALRRAEVPAELHVYRPGRHGIGLGTDVPGTDGWPEACAAWMRTMGIIGE